MRLQDYGNGNHRVETGGAADKTADELRQMPAVRLFGSGMAVEQVTQTSPEWASERCSGWQSGIARRE